MINMTDREYRSLELVSYSSLSKLADSPQGYMSDKKEETSYMVLGTVVDMLLTQKSRFDEEVYVMTADKPSVETMLTYCNVFAETGDSTAAYTASGYRISPEAVYKKFEKDGRAYYDALLAAKGKIIIDAEGMFVANNLVNQLTTNLFTKGYFVEDRSPYTELKFQVSVLWNAQYQPLGGGDPRLMKIKSMIDVVRIDHSNKTITPIDLKTGAEGFMKSYWRWKRYLQASMYTDSLNFAAWDDPLGKMNDYEIKPMKFVFADTTLRNPPIIYSSTELDIHAGREGINYLEPIGGKIAGQGVDSVAWGPLGQIKRKGYLQLIAELDWHQRNDKWDYRYEDYQNMGERQINAFGIKL